MNKKILKYSIISIILYNLAMLVPITGFMLPSYKLKNGFKFSLREQMVTNILILLGIFAISRESIFLYITVFLIIELCYYGFKYIKTKSNKIKIFDRIIITSIISTIFLILSIKFINSDVIELKKMVESMYVEHYGMSENDLKMAFKFMKNYKYFLLYSYAGLTTYLTYLTIGRKYYKSWTLSYGWLVFYIVPFILKRFFNMDNMLLENLMMITKVSYIVYAARILYNFVGNKIKIDFLKHVISVILVFYFPNISFILGGIVSFKILKIKTV